MLTAEVDDFERWRGNRVEFAHHRAHNRKGFHPSKPRYCVAVLQTVNIRTELAPDKENRPIEGEKMTPGLLFSPA